MKIRHCKAGAILAAALALGLVVSGAAAQVGLAPVNPPMKDMSHTPQPVDSAGPPIPNDTRPNPAAQRFDALDPEHIGYGASDAAQKHPWLANHFTACDADHNGQVTRPEYGACIMKKQKRARFRWFLIDATGK